MTDRLTDRNSGRLRVKVCCIASVQEAQMAMDAGADAIGLVSAMPSGPGVVGEDVIEEVIRYVDERVATVLLTSRVTAELVLEQARRLGPRVLQLVDMMDNDALEEIRDAVPGTLVMPVLHVPEGNALPEAVRVGAHADLLLLDSGNPGAPVRELGGTGRTHDWATSAAIVSRIAVPVFLAGGLNVGNVRAAVDRVKPFGVDVCSGVRTNGQLDARKLTGFMAACRS